MFEILWAFIAGLLKRRFASHVGSQENPWTIQTRSNTGQYRLVFRTEWDMIYFSIFGADRTKNYKILLESDIASEFIFNKDTCVL